MNNAVGTERISKVVGYKIKGKNFSEPSQNLPQRIAILAEANEANQGSLDLNPKEVTSAQQAGQLYGYGSPIYTIMRILRPKNGDGVGGIPTVVYPQAKAGGAANKQLDVVPTTAGATGNGVHTLVIAGRKGLDGVFYDINIETGDNAAAIAAKITAAISNVLGCPFTAVTANTPDRSSLTSKWNGLTANGLTVTVDTNGNDLGVSYAVNEIQAGSGTPSIQAALDLFGSAWNTIVINSYGTVTTVMDTLEAFNGIPDPENPTGRFQGVIMKPFIAVTGSVAEDPSSVTDARKANVTIAIAPAPLSSGLPMEAAANMALLFGRQAQDTPHLDVSGRSYPDMPTPADIGDMSVYDNRDAIVKKGCSTVDLISERYVVQDFVTTYHPVGEEPPQFRYCRNLMIDFNVRYGYYLQELTNVVDHAIANDNDTVSVAKVVKPKQWKQIVDKYADNLAQRALIVDPKFMQDSIDVQLSTSNPDRLETFFRYKRSGFARIASTEAEAGFNFGSLN
jgi:phage tail sheath gpL-like